MSWNDFNNLIGFALNGTAQESDFYDTDGIRRIRPSDGTSYTTSGGVSLSEQRPTSGQVSFIQGHQLLGLQEGGNVSFFLTDGLSSVRQVVNSSGTSVATFATDEYGVPSGSTGSSELLANTYVGALGVRNETGTPSGSGPVSARGLYYMNQRWMDPSLGRFISQDPIGFRGGLNLYGYVGGNPISRTDPSGLILTVTGESGVGSFLGLLSRTTGYQFDISSSGVVTIGSGPVNFEGTSGYARQLIRQIIDSKLNNKVQLAGSKGVCNRLNVNPGRFAGFNGGAQGIDIYDLLALETQSPFLASGLLVHELAENYVYNKGATDYDSVAHPYAISAENLYYADVAPQLVRGRDTATLTGTITDYGSQTLTTTVRSPRGTAFPTPIFNINSNP